MHTNIFLEIREENADSDCFRRVFVHVSTCAQCCSSRYSRRWDSYQTNTCYRSHQSISATHFNPLQIRICYFGMNSSLIVALLVHIGSSHTYVWLCITIAFLSVVTDNFLYSIWNHYTLWQRLGCNSGRIEFYINLWLY